MIAAPVQEHALIGNAEVEQIAHLVGVHSEHVTHGHDHALTLRQLVEFALGQGDQLVAQHRTFGGIRKG